MRAAAGEGRKPVYQWRGQYPRAVMVCGTLVLQMVLLVTVPPAGADEPRGFRDRIWGTPWDGNAVRNLPGCWGQGEVVTDVEGLIARVAQPECVGYQFADELTVNQILLYPEIKWHRLDQARAVLRTLLSCPEVWGLKREVAEQLETWSARLDRLAGARTAHGEDGPVFRDMAERLFDLADPMRGLQGYQVSFPREQYAAMKSVLVQQFGPPTNERLEWTSLPVGGAGVGHVLEWSWERAVAVMRDSGGTGRSGYFAIVTRDYRDLVVDRERAAARSREDEVRTRPVFWRNPRSYPWFLELLEGFEWANDR
jgi:hypothetical protein